MISASTVACLSTPGWQHLGRQKLEKAQRSYREKTAITLPYLDTRRTCFCWGDLDYLCWVPELFHWSPGRSGQLPEQLWTLWRASWARLWHPRGVTAAFSMLDQAAAPQKPQSIRKKKKKKSKSIKYPKAPGRDPSSCAETLNVKDSLPVAPTVRYFDILCQRLL